jgi:lysine-N-methylase
MRTTTLVRPAYAEKFCCVGPACEDSCCAGWRVDLDEATYAKYQALPPGPLRAKMDQHIVAAPTPPQGAKPGTCAHIQSDSSGRCPFHTAERLCQIQSELGADSLSETCATFPRTTFLIDKLEDRTLTLACPEAARLVLLNPNLLDPNLLDPNVPASRPEQTLSFRWNDEADGPASLRAHFWALREFSVGLIRNRRYPLWQRMFLLGAFARRLDVLVKEDRVSGFPALLREFSAAVASDSLRASIETIPADLKLQLHMVMELVKLRGQPAGVQERLRQCLDAFAEGVGADAGLDLDGQCARYAEAYTRYYRPFFARHPYILENLLVNSLFRRLFPLGASMFDAQARPEPGREFNFLATEFSLIKGLLIGVAGANGDGFSTAHVLHTVQTATKYFEHSTGFLERTQRLLAERGLDNARGVTMLIRN